MSALAFAPAAAAAARAFASRAPFPGLAPASAPAESPEAALRQVAAGEARAAALRLEGGAALALLLRFPLPVAGALELRGERFVLVAERLNPSQELEQQPEAERRTALAFAFTDGDRCGQLHRALGAFAHRRVALARIESHRWSAPDAEAAGAGAAAFLFYAEVTGHQREESVAQALAELRETAHFLRVLGSFPAEGALPIPTPPSGGEEDAMATKYPLNPVFETLPMAKSLAIFGVTKQMEAAGQDVYSLCVGEPDFVPSDRVIQAGIKTLEERNVRYSAMRGDIKLRKIIAEYYAKAKGLTYDPETEIQVTGGAQQAIYHVLFALIRPGDKVIVPSPYWGSYEAMTKQVRAGFVVLPGRIEEDYLINPKALEETLTANPETKVFILCNPSNPAGTLHSPEHLEQIAEVLRKPQFRHVVVISDEIYEQLVHQDEGEAKRVHKSFAALPGMYERTVIINGFSKAYAMTGLRIGFAAAPKHFIDPCLVLQAQLTSTANMVGQMAAVEALREEIECIEAGRIRVAEVLEGLNEKRQYLTKRLRAIPKLQFAHPTSAFYLFMDLGNYFRGKKAYSPDRKQILENVADYCEYLLREHHVAVAPGEDFGEEYGLRISYAGPMINLVKAMDGIEQTLNSLTFE